MEARKIRLRERLEKETDFFRSGSKFEKEVVASVWKGAGVVMRLRSEDKSIIVKRIETTSTSTPISEESYRVEQRFYRHFAKDYENIPTCYLQDERVVKAAGKKRNKRKKKRKNAADEDEDDILGSNWTFFSVLSDLCT